MTHLIVDTREKGTLAVLKTYFRKHEFKQLVTGDYACSDGCCLFERKEEDLHEGTFHKTLQQLSEMKYNNPEGNNYFIVNKKYDDWVRQGTFPQRLGFTASVTSRGFPPIFIERHFEMLEFMHSVIQKNHDSKFRGTGEFLTTRHVSQKDIALNILHSLPGIGTKQAKAIIEEFGSVMNFLKASEREIKSVKGIGNKKYDSIMDALCKEVDL